jgi:hypothetical protein
MKNTLAVLFLSSLILTACGGSTSKPADKVLDNSIFTEATGSGNISRCNDILDKALKASCEQVIDDRTATSAAVSDLDKSKCGKVSDERYRKECETQVDEKIDFKKKNENLVKELESNSQIENEALKNDDDNLCKKIEDLNQKNTCLYNVIANRAITKKDKSICKQLPTAEIISSCEGNVKL